MVNKLQPSLQILSQSCKPLWGSLLMSKKLVSLSSWGAGKNTEAQPLKQGLTFPD